MLENMLSDAKPVIELTRSDIADGLREAGLHVGDTVFVHSSLSAFGKVAGGADTVIDALLDVVGTFGTLVMPAFTWNRNHAADNVVFDMRRDGVKEEVGIIPETFRRRPGVLRSRHVCHSVTSIGPNTERVMGAGVSSFGQDSSFQALHDLNAVCLLLGVGFNVCTALHAAEEIVQVPYRYYRDYEGSITVMPDGNRIPSASVEYLRKDGYRNDFGKTQAVFENEGIPRTVRIGAAAVIYTCIRDIIDSAVRHLRKDNGFLLAD